MRQSRPDREVYLDADALLPEMPMVGWTRPRRSSQGTLGAHSHEQIWELCWLPRGEVDWWVGEESHTVAQGHCYLTKPGEVHGGEHDLLQPCELFWIHFRLQDGRMPGFAIDDVAGRLAALPRIFRGDGALSRLWLDVLQELREPDRLSAVSVRATLHRLLLTALRCGERHVEPQLSPELQRALAAARQSLDGRVRVVDMARAARLSPSRFHSRFLAEIGEPPAAWLRRQRLRLAKRMLAAGRPVTEVALASGFPSSQWFATVFRRYTGVAPSAWSPRRTPT